MDNPLAIYDALPEPAQKLLLSLAGKLAGDMLNAGGYVVKKRFEKPPRQAALEKASARALGMTAAWLADDPDLVEHYLGILDAWTDRPAVSGELSQVADPRPDTELDLMLLSAQFEQIKYYSGPDAETLHEELSFEQIVVYFVRAFYDAAALEQDLQGAIEIGLLRGIAERSEKQLRESEKQTRLQKQAVTTLQRMAPELDMSDLETHYLIGLYQDCNELTLAGKLPKRGARVPRMQKVYVDLYTSTSPSWNTVFDRLDVPADDRPALLQRVQSLSDKVPAEWGGQGEMAEVLIAERAKDRQSRRLLEAYAEHPLAKYAEDAETFQAAMADLSALEAVRQFKQLVILGDPGSGKSTFSKRLAGALAACSMPELEDEERDWQAQIGPACEQYMLPLRVVLSHWAQTLPKDRKGKATDLLKHCLHLVEEAGELITARQREQFRARFVGEKPTVMVILDGLDEVTDREQRKHVVDTVSDFVKKYPNVTLIATCRLRSYQRDEDSAEDHFYTLPLTQVTLKPLSDQAISDFIVRWHGELEWAGLYQKQAAQRTQARLLSALRNPDRAELREMAGTPLLLTLMASVNAEYELPDERAALYALFIKQVLFEWERLRQDNRGEETSLELTLQHHGVTKISLERALAQLAYNVHGQRTGKETVDINRAQIWEALEAIRAGDDKKKAMWIVEVLKLMDERSGLILALEQGKSYRFTHRTFQEYLAARWMATGQALAKFKERIDDEQWREAVFLAFGYQISVNKDYDAALTVLKNLLPGSPQSEKAWRRVLLLGEAYARLLGPQRASEAEGEAVAQEVIAAVPALLRKALWNDALPPRQRLEAGLLENNLHIDPPDLDRFIPALDEPSTWGFHIACYPVTNKQYRRFVDAHGYDEQDWWSEKGWSERQERGRSEPRYWDEEKLNQDNQPVVGVSWYEANAYCRWLTEELRNTEALDNSREVRLPTREEWMQVAGADEGSYPWGDPFDTARANTKESHLGQTTPVHMYPGGKTPEGVWDLSGNVWEWMADVDTDGLPWLKGGAWFWGSDRASSSARFGWLPHLWVGLGFRVVVVPISRE